MFTRLSPFIPADEQEDDFPGRVGSFFWGVFYHHQDFGVLLKSVCVSIVSPRTTTRGGEICLAFRRARRASRSKPITSSYRVTPRGSTTTGAPPSHHLLPDVSRQIPSFPLSVPARTPSRNARCPSSSAAKTSPNPRKCECLQTLHAVEKNRPSFTKRSLPFARP